ncbi:MAG: ABC transporter substrate-binding protein, partial [Thermoplasmata archaeon]
MWLKRAIIVCVTIAILQSGIQTGIGQEGAEEIDILRCAIKEAPSTNMLNPFGEEMGGRRILNLVYDSATKYHPDTGNLMPYIAVGSANTSGKAETWDDCTIGNFGYSPKEVWKESGKPEIIIFYDFEGVHWHDDVQMNTRDIMFSFHAHAMSQYPWLGHPLKDRAGKRSSNYSDTHWLHIYETWTSGDGQRAALRFVLQEPTFSVFDYYLSLPLLPYHIWGGRAARQSVDNALIWCDADYSAKNTTSWQPSIAKSWANTHPVGSGPFMWGDASGDSVTLLKWENHFYRPGYKYEHYGITASQPSIGGISFFIYRNEEMAILDLERDELDYIAWGLPPSEIGRFIDSPKLGMSYLKGAAPVFMAYNMEGKSFGYGRNAWQQLTDKDVGKPLRRAIAHCVDPVTINFLTNYIVDGAPLGTFSEWANTSSPQYVFDPGEAISILKKSGYLLDDPYQPPGNGNWWHNPDGSFIGSSFDGTIELLILEQDQN